MDLTDPSVLGGFLMLGSALTQPPPGGLTSLGLLRDVLPAYICKQLDRGEPTRVRMNPPHRERLSGCFGIYCDFLAGVQAMECSTFQSDVELELAGAVLPPALYAASHGPNIPLSIVVDIATLLDEPGSGWLSLPS